ncbi:MAG: slipin family protein [Clostridia bacterium]|nr:slipin family protein [Clostridia bacterium]
MKAVTIGENEKGLLFRNGKFVKVLDAGKYPLFFGRQIVKAALGREIGLFYAHAEVLCANKDFARRVVATEVRDGQLLLHYVDGNFRQALAEPGKHLFWKAAGEHTFRTVDLSDPLVEADLPAYILKTIPKELYTGIDVEKHEKACLYCNGKFVRLLEPGHYYFWKTAASVEVCCMDTRLLQMNVTGQEIMTQDKIPLRINFVCNYRVTDYVRVKSDVDDYIEQMHVTAQLALRSYIGSYKLDEILEAKDRMAAYVLEKLKEKEATLYVEITDAGIKDIILPGAIREIMNTVLLAEKKAQAGVIARREEVASTRSLLNTAKLMEENPTLYKLKELEYVERICENVGSVNISGGGDLLTQLLGIVQNKQA